MAGSPRGDRHSGLARRAALAPLRLGVALALLTGAGCRERAPQPSADSSPVTEQREQPQPAALQLAIAGCQLLMHEGQRRCYLGKQRRVHLLLREGGGKQLRARFEGRALASELRLDARDLVLELELPGPGQLIVEHVDGSARYRVELREHSPTYAAAWERAQQAFATQGFTGLTHALSEAEVEADERALFECMVAPYAYASDKLDAQLSRTRANPAPACRGLPHMLASYRALYEHPDLESARAHIHAAFESGREDAPTFIGTLYYEAGLQLSLGEIDEAIATLERVVELSAALDDLAQLGSAQVTLAVALARLGRFEEAMRLAEDARAVAENPEQTEVTVTEILDNIAWLQLLRREDDPSAPDPRETLAQLAATYTKLERPDDLARTQLHAALAAIQAGDVAGALAAWSPIDREQLTPLGLVWFELVGARIARLERRYEAAQAHLERARLFGELHEDPELDWYVLAATATLARARGQGAAALSAYEQAASLANSLALSVPGSAGRSMVVTSHSRLDADHLSLLLELGRTREAACVAAGTRARHLRALWARLRPALPEAVESEYRTLLGRHADRRQEIELALEQAWSLSQTELEQLRTRLATQGEQADAILERATALLEARAPHWSCEQLLPSTRDEALLTMAPSADESRWHFILTRGDTSESLPIEGEGRTINQIAAQALTSLAPSLAGAQVLTVVPVADFVSVDVHALLLPLPQLSELRLRYSLGLGKLGAASALRPASARAAVVGGDTNLDAVREELAGVRTQLSARGWSVERRWSPASETQPTLLHFAGHGYREGLGGWDSYIELPHYGRLSATKLVAEQQAPALVVLGACSAGSSDATIIDGGMNLAAAFLLAGAELVIAASGPVDDDAALAMSKLLYTGEGDKLALDRELALLQRRELAGEAPAPLGSGDETTSSLRWRAWVP